MIDIIAVCGAAVITAALALMLRNHSPHSAMLMSVSAGAVILISIAGNLPSILGELSSVLADAGLDSGNITVLLKVVAICFITEFTCDCVSEAGLMSLSTNISFAGKILVLVSALPLFNNVIAFIGKISGE